MRYMQLSVSASVLLLLSVCGTGSGLARPPKSQEKPLDGQMNVGLILPHTSFGVREYTKAINTAVSGLHKTRGPRFRWLQKFGFATSNVHHALITLTPSPTG